MTREIDKPIHPWSGRLRNLPEGKGEFYHWGPNYTVDPIVFAGGSAPSVLLILRKKDQQWAIPGGFVDPEDADTTAAARRELYEETSLEIGDQQPNLVYTGPVEDPRSTRYAWPETTAVLWRTDTREEIAADDDAADARWFSLDALPDNLYGSHAALIEQAIEQHGTLHERVAYYRNHKDSIEPSGGHMGYERRIMRLPEYGRIFIKHHAKEHFSDKTREQHSRDYLRKEFAVYSQLAPQIPHIAHCIGLIDDHTLVLEACDPRDGWYWHAPSEELLQARYISDIVAALREVEQLSFKDSSTVPPAHHSFEHEGWRKFAQNRELIHALLRDSHAYELLDDLDQLYQDHLAHVPVPIDSFAHTDLRQSNVAWHPEYGVRIVDWSWASPSASGLDTTSFIIDLAKSGVDVGRYMEHFDPHHARTLIGFWLGRATLPTYHETNVRQAQLASAVVAHTLLRSLRTNK